MRVYISGAITGTVDFKDRFVKAQEELELQGYSVINPEAVYSMFPKDTSYEDYRKMSFTMLEMCDAIYMLHGWEKSCSANREYGYAWAKDMIIIKES